MNQSSRIHLVYLSLFISVISRISHIEELTIWFSAFGSLNIIENSYFILQYIPRPYTFYLFRIQQWLFLITYLYAGKLLQQHLK